MAKVSDFQNTTLRRCLSFLRRAQKNRLARYARVVAICLVLAFPSIVYAHSSGPPQLADAVAGPYRVFVWMQPEPLRVGDVHVSVLVTQNGTGDKATPQPVPDAQIILRLEPIDQPVQAITVVASPQPFLSNIYYEADVQLRSSGQWRTTIEVAGVAGKGKVAFGSTVLAARTLNWWLIGSASVLLILLLGLIGIWSRMQANAQPTLAQEKTERLRV
jgi:hypothetical protein